jgi:serine/threonine-protein kinase
VLQGLDGVSVSAPAFGRPGRARSARFIAIGVVALVVIVAALIRRRPPASAAPSSGMRTLAVLPFENVGRDSAQDYLVDGLTDELTTAFGKLPGVRLAARTATYRYRSKIQSGEGVDAREVGRTLSVEFVLTGSVRSAGRKWRVSAQLNDATNGQEILSQHFDKDTTDLFALESDVARDITGALAPRLASPAAAAAAPARVAQGTENQDAYSLYLRGRFLLAARRTLPQAVNLFQQAIDKDSSFARAYAALGETLEYLPYFNGVSADSVRLRAMHAAQRALAIDSTLAQAHIALGLAHMHAYEWSEAGDEFRRAIAADSNDAAALTQYARYLLYVGRPAEALDVITRASALEPFSPVISAWKVGSLSLLGRHDEALAESRRGLEIDSTSAPLVQISTLAYLAGGRADEARQLSMHHLAATPPFGAEVAYAAGRAGDRATALRMAQGFESNAAHAWFAYFSAASAQLGVADTARALTDLELATNAREIWPSFTPLCDYSFDAIRGSKRFAALLRRVGLDEALLTRPGACRVK